MAELSFERIEKILHEETAKKEEMTTILRSVYTRYRHLYQEYFADIDALNDDKIAELRKYNEETQELIKVYYLDIPQDTCTGIEVFEEEYSSKLLGPEWHEYLFSAYEDFKEESADIRKSEAELKAEFAKQALDGFYEAMDSALREGFGTKSKGAENVISGIAGLLFGKGKEK